MPARDALRPAVPGGGPPLPAGGVHPAPGDAADRQGGPGRAARPRGHPGAPGQRLAPAPAGFGGPAAGGGRAPPRPAGPPGGPRPRGAPAPGGCPPPPPHSGGGALVDLGWHLLDTAATVLGGPVRFLDVLGSVSADFVNDGARSAGWRGTEGPDGEGDVEDTARGFLTTDTGVSVAVRASWASHEPVDTTRITVEGATGSATLVCTFGFSPNRRVPRLTRTRDGVTTDVPLHGESVGAEYVRQLDALPALLADPASRGAAVTQAHYTISVIERLYAGARAPRPRLADEATALAV
ncbi:Gfo/Idh/MocA family protein [Kitasatospora sp. NPDC001574]